MYLGNQNLGETWNYKIKIYRYIAKEQDTYVVVMSKCLAMSSKGQDTHVVAMCMCLEMSVKGSMIY